MQFDSVRRFAPRTVRCFMLYVPKWRNDHGKLHQTEKIQLQKLL